MVVGAWILLPFLVEVTRCCQLIFQDDFNGERIDENNWSWITWDPYHVNNEWQSYSNNPANSYIEDGKLVIRAIENNKEYTSARLVSSNKFDFKYGYVEVSASLPTAPGAWPAIWALPTDWVYGGWPASGEIDIMEAVSCDIGKIHGTVHTKSYNHMIGTQKGKHVDIGAEQFTKFNKFQLHWSPDIIKVGVNDVYYFSFSRHGTFREWPFDQRFHLIFNVAVGGMWGGYCLNNKRPSFPDDGVTNTMKIDYVKVYQGCDVPQEAEDCSPPYEGFPECEGRIAWLMQNDNWKKPHYADRGVTSGERCALQTYLNKYESYCPKCSCVTKAPTSSATVTVEPTSSAPTTEMPSSAPTSKIAPSSSPSSLSPTEVPSSTVMIPSTHPTTAPTRRRTKGRRPKTARPTRPRTLKPTFREPTDIVEDSCAGPYPSFSQCQNKIDWLLENFQSVSWSDVYVSRGVDGTTCRAQRYLHSQEHKCPDCDCATEYLGCFRQIRGKLTWHRTIEDLTPMVCRTFCSDKTSHFATTSGNTCVCFLFPRKRTSANRCNLECAGDYNESCGGRRTYQVFRNNNHIPPPPTSSPTVRPTKARRG